MSTERAALTRRSGDGGDDRASAVVSPSGRSLGPGWRKSSHSEPQGCVQIALPPDGAVLLGDSRTPEGSVVRMATAAWVVFLQAVRSGELD